VILDFDKNMELMLRMIEAKTQKPMGTIIVEALAIYDAVIAMGGEPAVIKDGKAHSIKVEHSSEGPL
jgi:hypothetical protein